MAEYRPEASTLKQKIVAFHQDEQSDWIAELSCGHGQHVRHNPPWLVREWVLTKEGREGFIGRVLECAKCDQEMKSDGRQC
jgi:hypothetical protein